MQVENSYFFLYASVIRSLEQSSSKDVMESSAVLSVAYTYYDYSIYHSDLPFLCYQIKFLGSLYTGPCSLTVWVGSKQHLFSQICGNNLCITVHFVLWSHLCSLEYMVRPPLDLSSVAALRVLLLAALNLMCVILYLLLWYFTHSQVFCKVDCFNFS